MEKITVIVIAILFVVVSAIGIVGNAEDEVVVTPKQFGPKAPGVQIQEWKINRDRAKAESIIKGGEYMTETNDGQFIISKYAQVTDDGLELRQVSYPKKMDSLRIPFQKLFVLYIRSFESSSK